jgi:hypothetical protein
MVFMRAYHEYVFVTGQELVLAFLGERVPDEIKSPVGHGRLYTFSGESEREHKDETVCM